MVRHMRAFHDMGKRFGEDAISNASEQRLPTTANHPSHTTSITLAVEKAMEPEFKVDDEKLRWLPCVVTRPRLREL